MKTRMLGTLTLGLAFGFGPAVPLVAQSTGPSHAGFDANAPTGGHYHEGEIGEKLMVLERSFKCNCGCGLDVHSCQFQMQCGTSPVWSERIRAELEAGRDIETIEAGFVADFGGTVLMLPPPEGFNLLGYLLPGFAILTAGMMIGLITRGGTSGPTLAPVDEPTDDQSERLRVAMRVLDESEGPDW